MMTYRQRLFLGMIAVFAFSASQAGETGKISGRVYDKNTKEPLLGATIMIVGMPLGAAADEQGKFFILRVPPGTYTVQASMIGYKTLRKTQVTVSADLTTPLDFELESTVLSGEEITVLAERPVVQRDLTSSTRTVDAGEISRIPNAVDIRSAVAIQPGVIANHFRGGRTGETRYMIDGVPIDNPVIGGYSGLNVNKDAIQEMQVITGGYNAEFGQAQSGVVNIITKEGSDHFVFSFDHRSDLISPNSQQYLYNAVNAGGPLFRLFNRRLYYFVSSHFSSQDGYVPWREPRRQVNFLGVKFRGRYYNDFTLNSKLTYAVHNNLRLTMGTFFSGSANDPYVHQYKYLPDATTDLDANDSQYYLILNHILSARTFYSLRLSYLSHQESKKVNGKNPNEYSTRDDFWRIGMDSDNDGFVDHLEDQNWSEQKTRSVKLKMDLTSQIHANHMIKTGVEISYYDLYELSIAYPGWIFPERDTIDVPGAWKLYGGIRTAYHVYPNIGSIYFQDKMEYQGLIVNAGLRYDYWMPGEQVMNQTALQKWEHRVYSIYDPRRGTTRLQKVKGHLSPRLGISYPITEKSMMYISYGKFSQTPPLYYAYRDASYAGIFAGNPYHLDAEITTAYEFGFTYELFRNTSLNFKTFYKDTHGLIGIVRAREEPQVLLFTNKDYGTIRGFEIELKNRPTSMLFVNLNYTYSYAMGRSSDAAMEYWYGNVYKKPLPMREFRLDWDQRHTVNLVLDLNVGKNNYPHLFGLRLPDLWGINLLVRYGSGLPYTPAFTSDFRKQPPYNTLDKPYTLNTDVKINKDLPIRNTLFSFYIEVLNLFNKINTYQVNPVTGQAYRFGDYVDIVEKKILSWREIQPYLDPTYAGPGRRFNLGIRIYR